MRHHTAPGVVQYDRADRRGPSGGPATEGGQRRSKTGGVGVSLHDGTGRQTCSVIETVNIHVIYSFRLFLLPVNLTRRRLTLQGALVIERYS